MTFEFVNNTAIDPRARKRIRSHVAKGRNLGKTLPPKRKPAEVVKVTLPFLNPASRLVEEKDEEETDHLAIERQIGDGLSVLPLPVDLAPQARGLVKTVFTFLNYSLYAPELNKAITFGGAAGPWIDYIFEDQAYFHCTVALCISSVNTLRPTPTDSIQVLHHLSSAFRLVNEKLTSKEVLADTTLAVITGLSMYERVRGQYQRGLVHFEGLCKMVELRGGIGQVVRKRAAIAQKIFRADLEFAMVMGSPTRFDVVDVPGSAVVSWLRDLFVQDCQSPFGDHKVPGSLSQSLKDSFVEVSSLAWFLNGGAGLATKLDGYLYYDAIILIGYRLVNISPLGGPRPSKPIENVLHLGLLGFVTTLFRGFGRKTPDLPLLAKQARFTTQAPLEDFEDYPKLYLWILFMTTASISLQMEDQCLITRIRDIALALGLHTWEDVRWILSGFPWVNSLHDEAGEATWLLSRT